MSSEIVWLIGVLGGSALLIAAPAVLLVWLMRTRLRVTVYDAGRQPVAGALVMGHLNQQHGGYLAENGRVTEVSSSTTIRRLGRTGADGILDTWLLLSSPWALHAEGPGERGRSQPRILPAQQPREPIVIELHLQKTSR